MLLGIPYHAALIFATGEDWLVVAPDRSAAFQVLADFMRVWRMPTFFVIAGFFAVLMLRRRGPRAWLRGRAMRLGLPLLFGLLLVNPIAIFLRTLVVSGSPRDARTELMTSAALFPGGFVEHLWFLVELLIYCTVFALIAMTPLRHKLGRAGELLIGYATRSTLSVIVALIVLSAVVAGALASWNYFQVYELTRGLVSHRMAYYAPFFVLGCVLALNDEYRKRVLTRPSSVTFVIAGAMLIAFILLNVLIPEPSIAIEVAQATAATVGGAFCARVLFWLAGRIFTARNGLVDWLVSSSIVIYIVHQPVVVLTALFVLPVGLPSILSWLAIITITLVTSAVLSWLLMKWRPLRVLATGSARPQTGFVITPPRDRRKAPSL